VQKDIQLIQSKADPDELEDLQEVVLKKYNIKEKKKKKKKAQTDYL